MNSSIENALKLWLQNEGIKTTTIHTGLTGDNISQSDQFITCYVSDSQHVVGKLHKTNIAIVVVTPPHSNTANNEATALTAHRTLVTTVTGLIDDFDNNSLRTIFDANTSYTFSGGFLNSEETGIDDERWVTTLNFMIGVSRP